MRSILVFFHEKYNGNWVDIYLALAAKEKVDPEEAEECYNRLSAEYNIITMLDDNYPEMYKNDNYDKPPFVLFEAKTENTLC
jgi:predicted Rossmann fold nucleotide-binding protein DprA/Smf involved in DNA uptake